jgi:hypothetical protein
VKKKLSLRYLKKLKQTRDLFEKEEMQKHKQKAKKLITHFALTKGSKYQKRKLTKGIPQQ